MVPRGPLNLILQRFLVSWFSDQNMLGWGVDLRAHLNAANFYFGHILFLSREECTVLEQTLFQLRSWERKSIIMNTLFCPPILTGANATIFNCLALFHGQMLGNHSYVTMIGLCSIITSSRGKAETFSCLNTFSRLWPFYIPLAILFSLWHISVTLGLGSALAKIAPAGEGSGCLQDPS